MGFGNSSSSSPHADVITLMIFKLPTQNNVRGHGNGGQNPALCEDIFEFSTPGSPRAKKIRVMVEAYFSRMESSSKYSYKIP